jgi:tripeptide aminopeptidase
LSEKEALLKSIVDAVVSAHPQASYSFEVREQYRNMKEVLDKHPQVVSYALEAIQRTGLKPVPGSIRGGTDGSRLSFMGLPCPNLFAGQQAIHSKHEFICVQDMNKAVETLVHLVQLVVEKS